MSALPKFVLHQNTDAIILGRAVTLDGVALTTATVNRIRVVVQRLTIGSDGITETYDETFEGAAATALVHDTMQGTVETPDPRWPTDKQGEEEGFNLEIELPRAAFPEQDQYDIWVQIETTALKQSQNRFTGHANSGLAPLP